jgi:hypothetical protein
MTTLKGLALNAAFRKKQMCHNSEPEEIIIPQGVTRIEDMAFQRCPGLSYVDLFPFVALVFDHCSLL